MSRKGDDFFSRSQENLQEVLKKRHISPETIQSLIDDGYYVMESDCSRLMDRYDGHYSHYIPIDAVHDDGIHFEIYRDREIPIVDVGSVEEVQEYLSKTYQKMNPETRERFVYRGQNTSYYVQRKHTNPWFRLRNGKEPSLIPGYWRSNLKLSSGLQAPANIFQTVLADPIIYYGIDIEELHRRNCQKYGYHSLSDLADFDDPISQEYHRRWELNKIYAPDIWLLAQHYGFSTACLDVTFDLKVAFFFAAYKFQTLNNGKATYRYNPNRDAVVYCLLYTDTPLRLSRDLVTNIACFDHLTPKRPLTQHCSLVGHNALDINGSAANILVGFRMKEGFDASEIPKPPELFPGPTEDPFYERLLDMKYNSSAKEWWQEVVDYDFF